MDKTYYLKKVILLTLCLLSFSAVSWAQDDTPCECAQRYTEGASWNTDGTVDDTPNGNDGIPNQMPEGGVVRCGSSAENQSGIDPNGCTYNPAEFDIDLSNIACINPQNVDANGIPAMYAMGQIGGPGSGDDVVWIQYDIRFNSTDYQFQVNSNDDLVWALYYLQPGETSSTPNCDQDNLILQQCGTDFPQQWNNLLFETPDFNVPTNFYLAIWRTNTGGSFSLNFKTRNGCGDFLDCLDVTCPNEDGGTYDCTADVPAAATTIADFEGLGATVDWDNTVCPGILSVSSSDEVMGACSTDNVVLRRTYTVLVENDIGPDQIDICVIDYSISNGGGPDIICPADETVACADDITEGTPTVTVSCSLGSTVTTAGPTLVSGQADCPGAEYEIEYTVEDDCGRTSSCTQTFTIANDAPTITCPADETVACANDITEGTPTVTVSCSLGSTATTAGPTLVSGQANCPGAEYEIVYTVEDVCGRTANCTQTFTIADATLGISCPADETVDCFDDISVGTPMVTISCGLGSTVTTSGPTLTSGQANCPGAQYEIVYTVNDACGRTANCTQTFTIAAATLGISCPADETVDCFDDILVGTPMVTISCGLGSTVTTSGPTLASGQANCPGAEYEIIYTVNDACGRTTNCTQTFTIANAAPTITCPPDQTVECPANIVAGTPTVMTSCGIGFNVATSGPTLTSGMDGANGATYDLVYTATDGCGRMAQCTQVWTLGNVEPSISCPPDETVECFDDISIGNPTVVVSCGLASTVTTNGPNLISGQENCNGAVYEVEYILEDELGRTEECTQSFTLDNAAPTITCPADETVACADDIMEGTPTVTVSCSLGSTYTAVGPALVLGQADCPGAEYEIVYTVEDDCGRTSSCIQTFTIANDAPTITCPTNETVACSDDIMEGTPIVTVSCSIGSTVTTAGPTLVFGQADCPGAEYEIVYTVEDDCGRTANCTRTFTIANDAPIISCPADETVACADDIMEGTPTTTLSCSLGSTVTAVGPALVSGQADCPGAEYEIVYTVEDDCGRTTSCTQTFTIDNTAPVISCPPDLTVECVSDIVAGMPTVTTSCDVGSTITTSGPTLTSGTDGADGATYDLVYTITDACGRMAQCTQTWTLGNIGPSIICPPDEAVECFDDISEGTPTVTTSCGLIPNISSTGPTLSSGQEDCDGATYEIVYTVEDALGRTDQCTQTFTISNTGPSFVCPPGQMVACLSDISEATPTVTTSCGLTATLTATAPSLVSGQNGCNGSVYNILYTAEDECGRTSQCTQTWTLSNAGPTFTCPSDQTVTCFSEISIASPTVNSSCGLTATLTTSGPTLVSGEDECNGAVYNIVYTAEDECGRTSQCTQTWTLSNAGPTFTCPSDQTVTCFSEISIASPTVTASCGLTATLTTSGPTLVSGEDGCNGAIYNIVYTAEDECGRTSQCTQTWNLSNTGPTFTCPPDQTITCFSEISIASPTVTASCGLTATLTTAGPTLVSGEAECDGAIYNIVYTAEDECGRTSQCTQIWTINTPNPTITCPTDATIECNTSIQPSVTGTATGTASCGGIPTITHSDNNTPAGCPTPETIIRTWTATDDCGNTATCTQTITIIVPQIGIAKQVSDGPTHLGNGLFSLTYEILVKNTGNIPLNSVQVVDDLSTTFAAATSFVVTNVTSSHFSVNFPGYDGSAVTTLLDGTDMLNPGESGTIEVSLNVEPGINLGPHLNTATAEGTSSTGTTVMDDSQDGTDVDPDDPNDTDPTDNNDPTPVGFFCVADAGDLSTGLPNNASYDICLGDDFTDTGMNSVAISPDYSAPDETLPGPGYDYMILLTDIDGVILDAKLPPADFDFSTLAPGTYQVFGLSYFSGNPASLSDYLDDITMDGTLNDIAQIETDEASSALCLDLDGTDTFGNLLSIQINDIPVCNVTGDNMAIAGSQNNPYFGPLGVSSYSWSVSGNGTIDGPANQQSVAIDAGATGSFIVMLTTTNASGCSSSCSMTVSIDELPVIGLAKDLTSVVNNGNGVYDVTYLLTVENFGDVPLNSLMIFDDILGQFAGMNPTNLQATDGTLNANPFWDGQATTNILSGIQLLPVGATGTVSISFSVTPGNVTNVDNTATAKGTSPSGVDVTDTSTDGFDPDGDDDDDDPDESEPTPTPFDENPTIGIAKVLTNVTNNLDGTYDVSFLLTIENFGDVVLSDVMVFDNIFALFPGMNPTNLQAGSGTLTANPLWNGQADSNILMPGQSLNIGQSGTVNISFTVTPNGMQSVLNQASAEGTSPAGEVVTDMSTDGFDPDGDDDDDDPDESDPTIVPFEEGPIIGLSKTLVEADNLGDGTYEIYILLMVENFGDVPLTDLMIFDDIVGQFAATNPTNFIASNGTLQANPIWNGQANSNILAPGQSLAVGETGTVSILFTVTPGAITQIDNLAIAQGTSPGDEEVTDTSTDGIDPDGDDDDDNPDESEPTPVPFGENPGIGLAKTISDGPTHIGNGVYGLTFVIKVQNTGDVMLNNVQVTDDLAVAFAGAAGFSVTGISSAEFPVNEFYNGTTSINLLSGPIGLEVDEVGYIEVTVEVTPGTNPGTYLNTAIGRGTSPGDVTVEDASQDGTDVDPDDPDDSDPTDNNDPTPIDFPCIADAGDLVITTAVGSGPGFVLCEGDVLLDNMMNPIVFDVNYANPDEFNPGLGYDYVLLLVNSAGEIVGIQDPPAGFDFGILTPDIYTVYGLSYFGANPATLNDYLTSITTDGTANDIGQMEADELAGVICLDLDAGTLFAEPFTVVIHSQPTAGPLTGPSSVCTSSDLLLDPAPSGGSGVYVGHEWTDLGTGTASGYSLINTTSQVLTIDATGASPGTINLVYNVTDNAGCTASFAVTISVVDAPQLSVTNVSCAADFNTYTIDITTNSSNIAATSGTVVDNGGGSFTITGIPIAENTTVTAGDPATGCQASQTVNAPDCNCPTIDPPISFGGISMCEGDSPPPLAVSVGAGLTADWYDAPSGGNLLAMGTPVYTPPGPGTFYVETRDPSTDCVSNTRTEVVLSVNPSPSVGTITGAAGVCAGDEIILTGDAIGGTAPLFHVWGLIAGTGMADLVNNNDGTVTITGLAAGTVEVTYNVIDANGCKSLIASYPLSVNEVVVPSISVTTGLSHLQSCTDDDGAITIEGLTDGETYGITYTYNGTAMQFGPAMATGGSIVINGLAAGLYDDFIFTNLNTGCVSDAITGGPFELLPPVVEAPIADFVLTTNPTGCDAADGVIAIGGLLPGNTYAVSYEFDNLQQTVSGLVANLSGVVFLSGLEAGIYDQIFVLNNATGCQSEEVSNGPVELVEPLVGTPTIDLNLGVSDPTNCEEPDGFIIIENLTPGVLYTIFYTYNAVDQSIGPIAANANGEIVLNGLAGGIYNDIYLLDQSNNCVIVPDEDGPIVLTDLVALDAPVVADAIVACLGEEVQLQVLEPNPIPAGTTFLWTGTNGYQSTTAEPLLTTVTFADTGTYTVVMITSGCESEPASLSLTVNDAPETPTIVTNAPLCDGESLELGTSTLCDTYIWIGPAGASDSTLANPLLVTTTNVTTIPATDTAYLAGMWSVICVDANGCQSAQSLPNEVLIHPIPPDPIPTNSSPVCEGEAVQLFPGTTSPNNATYIWYDADPALPGANVVSSEPSPVLNSLSANGSPYEYWLQISVNGCTSEAVPTSIEMHGVPVAVPVNSVDDCGEELSLSANPTPPDTGNDYSYYWTGPGGIFFSDEANPVIPNLDAGDLGTYTVVITNVAGCSSAPGFTQLDSLFELAAPAIDASVTGPLCEGESIELVSEFFNGQDVSYIWTIEGDTTISITTDDPYLMIDSAVDSLHDGVYYVEVLVDGCLSDPSALVLVEVTPQPATPVIDANASICEGDDLSLETDFITGATYAWTGPLGFSASTHNPVISPAGPQHSGEYMVVVTMDDCPSEPAFVTVEVTATPEAPIASNNGPACEGEDLTLFVENPVSGATYEWYDQSTGVFVGVGESLVLSGAESGVYYVVMTLDACVLDPIVSSLPTAFTEVVMIAEGALVAGAGPDQEVCEDIAVLNADLLPLNEYATSSWSVMDGSAAIIENPEDYTTNVTGLTPGENTFVWTLAVEGCGAVSSDTVVIVYAGEILAADDQYTIAYQDSLVGFDVLVNDQFAEEGLIPIVSALPESGVLSQNPDGSFTFVSNNNFAGTVTFTYFICSEICPEICDEAVVTIDITVEDCAIPNVITPNGDGLNDTFIIPCAAEYPGSELLVFNRWGDEVYRADDYQNDWGGTYKEDDLPVGTYYYYFVLNDGANAVRQGYIYVQRN